MNIKHDYLQLILTLQCTHMLVQVTEGTGRIDVFQTPSEIEAFEGDSIKMQCSCEEDLESMRVDWTKDSNPILNATNSSSTPNPVYRDRLSYAIDKANAKLIIKNIAQDDAGLYLCKVFIEIPPPVRRGLGNGTKLTVQAPHIANYKPGLEAVVLFVILAAAILYYKKRQISQRNSRVQVPVDVVREVICEENHENEGNEENSSSRGSSQWVASSVYESFDYFAIKDKNEDISCTVSNS
ncbi:uncharacterized protein [Heterodontus francisci]|uniref:uncharacterized protein n=1 Tax=Heterodontus francisci TaxID=7792 RepID=UPI00355B667F